MSHSSHSWDLPLSRTLWLKDGRELHTLRDAAILLSDRLSADVRDDTLARALRLMMAAADAGTEEARRDATDGIASVLSHPRS
jgi:hypothetical protein